jgi:hypothetical protein
MSDFRGKIDPETAQRLAEADSPLKIKAIIGEAAARLSANPEDVLIPKQIGSIKGTRATFAARELARERIPVYRTLRNSRWFTEIPTEKAISLWFRFRQNKIRRNLRQLSTRNKNPHRSFQKLLTTLWVEAMNVFGEDKCSAIRKEAGDQLYAKFLAIVPLNTRAVIKELSQEVKRIHDAELARIRTFGIDRIRTSWMMAG